MSATRSRAVKPPRSWRDNAFPGDLEAWERAHSQDNSGQIERLRRNMRRVRSNELTPRQEEMLRLYYDMGLTMSQIAARLEVDKSTVSRTLARGRKNLKRYLQYSF